MQKILDFAPRWAWLATVLAFTGTGAASVAAAQDKGPAYKLPRAIVSEAPPAEGRHVTVKGASIHYLEEGRGDPIVFIHGNPTSSYLWRNVIPHVLGVGRAVAPDLVGMGRSGKPKIAYRYTDHYASLESFIEILDLKNITFVLHDWGAALGFDYALRNPDRVKRIAFMEGVLPPIFPQPSFEAMGAEMGGMFRAIKDPVQGRKLIVDDHMFIERILPGFVNRPLGAKSMDEYRRPYIDPRHREPLLAWPREIPIAGEPKDVAARMLAIKDFMVTTDKPMLLIYAEPGVLVSPKLVPWYVGTIRKLETAFVGQGLHFIQEDNPDAIGRALADWIRRN